MSAIEKYAVTFVTARNILSEENLTSEERKEIKDYYDSIVESYWKSDEETGNILPDHIATL